MTIAIALIGKSGSGKTTLAKSILTTLHDSYPDKSILLVDNDLSCELGYTFGIDIKDTIQNIRCGEYKYKSQLPDDIPRHEFIEWALQDLLINLFDDVDIIASGLIPVKESLHLMQEQLNDALIKLIKEYDIVIFDCEYDLAYLNQLVDFPIDVSLIISDTSITSVYSSAKINQTSLNLSSPGQIGLILNKVKSRQIPENTMKMLKDFDLDILGVIPFDEELEKNPVSKDSDVLLEATKELLFRLNLPPL